MLLSFQSLAFKILEKVNKVFKFLKRRHHLVSWQNLSSLYSYTLDQKCRKRVWFFKNFFNPIWWQNYWLSLFWHRIFSDSWEHKDTYRRVRPCVTAPAATKRASKQFSWVSTLVRHILFSPWGPLLLVVVVLYLLAGSLASMICCILPFLIYCNIQRTRLC